MSGPSRATVRNAAPSPRTHATVTVRVTLPNDTDGRLDGVDVQLVDTPHHSTTGSNGSVTFDSVRAGYHVLRCRRAGMGPSDGSSSVVQEGNAGGVVRILPQSELPQGSGSNVITVFMDFRHPIVHVHVAHDSTQAPVEGAHVRVTGTAGGSTNANGDHLSPSVPYHRLTVEVWHDNLAPRIGRNGRFTAVVEPRPGGAGDGALPHSRDLHLNVQMSNVAVPIPPAATHPVRVWIDGGATPISVDNDPRLPAPGAGDTPSGQDGWDMRLFHGTNSTTAALVQLLQNAVRPAYVVNAGQAIGQHQITRLAIVAHGSDGVMDIQQLAVGQALGFTPVESSSLTPARMSVYRSDLVALGRFLAADSIVYLCSCRLARTSRGEELLKELSLLWPSTRVVGLRSFGSVCVTSTLPRRRPGATGEFPGMRDSRHSGSVQLANQDSNNPPIWNDLSVLPWFSESSPRATIALDGNIVRRGDNLL